jgi:hypothetical protein
MRSLRRAAQLALVVAASLSAWPLFPACKKSSCVANGDCPSFNQCCGGACIGIDEACVECGIDSDCAGHDQVCRANRCVARVVNADAGPASDAMSPLDGAAQDAVDMDQGTQDAIASPDVGVDGGASDAIASGGMFNPYEMYFLGEVKKFPGNDLMCDVRTPNLGAAGFSVFTSDWKIRPSDGVIIYIDGVLGGSTLRQFVPDLTYDSTNPDAGYPVNPVSNDPIVPTPACHTVGSTIAQFFIHPGDSSIIYRCQTNDKHWFDSSGAGRYLCDPNNAFAGSPLAIAEDGSSFCAFFQDATIWSGTTAMKVTPKVNFFVVRPRSGGGFWAVTHPPADAGANAGRYERWYIDTLGTAAYDGVYAAYPSGFQPSGGDNPEVGNLDDSGRFYRWGTVNSSTTSNVIARFEADFSGASIIYDSSTNPICKPDGLNLITGP